jgi:hypothetical protein
MISKLQLFQRNFALKVLEVPGSGSNFRIQLFPHENKEKKSSAKDAIQERIIKLYKIIKKFLNENIGIELLAPIYCQTKTDKTSGRFFFTPI